MYLEQTANEKKNSCMMEQVRVDTIETTWTLKNNINEENMEKQLTEYIAVVRMIGIKGLTA